MLTCVHVCINTRTNAYLHEPTRAQVHASCTSSCTSSCVRARIHTSLAFIPKLPMARATSTMLSSVGSLAAITPAVWKSNKACGLSNNSLNESTPSMWQMSNIAQQQNTGKRNADCPKHRPGRARASADVGIWSFSIRYSAAQCKSSLAARRLPPATYTNTHTEVAQDAISSLLSFHLIV